MTVCRCQYWVAVLALTTLPGCAGSVLESRSVDSTLPAAIAYSLPQTLVTIEIAEQGGAIYIKSLETSTIPDPNRRYAIDVQQSALFDDDIEITVGRNGLLQKVDLTTTDRTGELIVSIAEAVLQTGVDEFPSAIAPSLVGSIETVFFRGAFVAGETLGDINAELQAAATQHMKEQNDWCDAATAPVSCYRISRFVDCERKVVLGAEQDIEAAQDSRAEQITKASRDQGGEQVAETEQCTDVEQDTASMGGWPITRHAWPDAGLPGIALRTSVSNTVKLKVGGRVVDSRTFMAIDIGKSYAVDIKRTRFVEQVANLTFEDGVLTKFELDKPSPAAEAGELAVSLLKLPFTLVAEILQLRVNVGTQELNNLQKELDVLKKKEEIREFLAEGEPEEAL